MGSQSIVAASPGHDGFWDTYSRYYDSVYSLIPYRGLLWDAFEALGLEPGMRVLDAGCGTGNFEHFIADKNHPRVTIDAVDFSPAMLERARVKCAGLDYIRFSEADLNEPLPFENATFDRIISVNVLYALKDQPATLQELFRVLRPGGALVLANPTPQFSWGPLALDHFRRIGNIWGSSRRAKALASSVVTMSTTAVGSFLLNSLVINRREGRGEYHSMDRSEMVSLLEQRLPEEVGKFAVESAMADQSLLTTASKVLAA